MKRNTCGIKPECTDVLIQSVRLLLRGIVRLWA